jgi:uncharacterized secreted protein with C-terminal beta-propeller domain
MKNKNLKISGILMSTIIIILSFVYAINVQPIVFGDSGLVTYKELNTFETHDQLTEFLCNGSTRTHRVYSGTTWGWGDMAPFTSSVTGLTRSDEVFMNFDAGESGGKLVDYSNTNIQVAGVDEPDIVKTDGEYLYIVSNNKVFIVSAVPAEDAEIISKIEVDSSFTIQNIFISGDRLVVIAQESNYIPYMPIKPIILTEPVVTPVVQIDETSILTDTTIEVVNSSDEEPTVVEPPIIDPPVIVPPPWHSSPEIHILVYDLEDFKNTELVDVSVPGHFKGARLIDDYVYLLTVQYSYEIFKLTDNNTIRPSIQINEAVKEISLSDISYIDSYSETSTITNIISVNIHDDEEEPKAKIYLLGDMDVLYVSKNNIYIAQYLRDYNYNLLQQTVEDILMPMLPESVKRELQIIENFQHLDESEKETVTEWILEDFAENIPEDLKLEIYREINRLYERTTIHRIHINNGKIEYKSQGSVPGRVKNQFSMSEHKGHLRVSSTMEGIYINYLRTRMDEQNNIYVLNMNLETVGGLEGLAPDEDIYATRFLGDICYLVTFRQIDPFFVIDLSNPTNPTLLGELKIPGYSTYLHPYDDNHIIGIGMEGRKVKISLFDVTDMSNPVELSKHIVETDDNGWRSSSSEALYEHKAFLFDKEKNLLVIPVGNYNKQSAYVFDITLEDGIELKGTITHGQEVTVSNETNTYYYSWDYGYSIKRTLYIGDVLYTISDNMVKMNSLEDLSEINSLELE